MSYEEEKYTLAEIIPHLPQRVKIAEAEDTFTFKSGDVIVLELESDVKIVDGTNRLTDEVIRMPYYYYQSDVYQLGKHISCVAEIEKEEYTFYSVEKSFETPISPWKTNTVPCGSVVELTDMEHTGGVVVKHGEEHVFIPYSVPLYFKAVQDEASSLLENLIEEHGLPLDIVIKDDGKSDDSSNCAKYPPGNYRLADVCNEKFVYGYSENCLLDNRKQQFIIPSTSNILVRKEILSPQTNQPYKNAFFVPKHLYGVKKSSELFLQYLFGASALQNDSDYQDLVPQLPPRTRPRSQVHRDSLKVNSTAAPVRPERRPRKSSEASTDVSFTSPGVGKANTDDFPRQTAKENQLIYIPTNLPVIDTCASVSCTPEQTDTSAPVSRTHQYMALNEEAEASPDGHVYDVMSFEPNREEADNVSNQNDSKAGIFQRCFKCLTSEKPVSVHDMSVTKLVALLNEHGLSQMASVCLRNGLDGAFVSDLTIEQLASEPFNLSDDQVETVMALITDTD